MLKQEYDVIVVGAGHAGCEAAHAAAKSGCSTLMLSMNLDTIAKMSCNPSIGGTAKGHIVREIDALGGLMGRICEKSAIHLRLLNASKGPAVRSPRAQCDKWHYSLFMKQALEETEGLDLFQGCVEDFLFEGGVCRGVCTREGFIFRAQAVIISSGTFMRGLLHVGDHNHAGGRSGDAASHGLSGALERVGVELGRLKTGTPARVHARGINRSKCLVQPSEERVRFSFCDEPQPLGRVDCLITCTTPATHEVIRENLDRSPLYGGIIAGVGPRYCPSIEDKVVRFADKERHQIFIEPEGLFTDEIYLNGISTSLPFDVQQKILQTIPGLEEAQIMRYGYAIEYDYALAGQINAHLMCRDLPGLFLAGQINGTTGYEEAAAQGLLAGVNAAAYIRGHSPLVLSRSDAYIGVMVDDLITKEHTEPYRMFTSRAEHRLLLRQDNADLRLAPFALRYGLLSEPRAAKIEEKRQKIERLCDLLTKQRTQIEGKSLTLAQLLCRPELSFDQVYARLPKQQHREEIDQEVAEQVTTQLRYAGYIEREMGYVQKLKELEHLKIPEHFDFAALKHLRSEARQKLVKMRPATLGQASRLQGVNPTDLQLLLLAVTK